MSDVQIIARAAKGDMKAFRALYDAHLGQVAGQVGRMLGPGHDVESVVQEVFIQVFKGLPGYRAESRFSTWLSGVTRHVVYGHLRSRSPVVALGSLRQMGCHDLEWSRLKAREKLKILYATLEGLSPEHREAFVMYELEGRTLAEIAELVGAPLNTVAARVRRARQRVRHVLEQADAAPGAKGEGGRP